jgi:hypothetical protein
LPFIIADAIFHCHYFADSLFSLTLRWYAISIHTLSLFSLLIIYWLFHFHYAFIISIFSLDCRYAIITPFDFADSILLIRLLPLPFFIIDIFDAMIDD